MLQHLNYLDDRKDEMVSLVERLCNVNSGTLNTEGVRQVADMLIEEYSNLDAGITTHSVPDLESIDDSGQKVCHPLGPLVHVVKRSNASPVARPRIVLCIHMDTVYDLQHPFQSCKWLDDKTLNGPGVADAKGGLVVMLYAIRAIEQSPVAGSLDWEVIMNPDEELGSPGSTEFLHERAKEAGFGLLFEPSLPDGTLVSWRKGSGNFHFVVRGRSVHSGRDFEMGRNAVVAVAKMMVEIDSWNTSPDITFNIGKVTGGSALNIVPDTAVGRVNVRVKTFEQLEEVKVRFAEITQRYSELDGISVEQFGQFRSTPKILDERTGQLQSLIEASGAELGIPVNWRGTGGASDGNKMAAVGLANIDTMGPQGGSIHSSDEFLLVDSLVPRAKLAALTMLKLASLS